MALPLSLPMAEVLLVLVADWALLANWDYLAICVAVIEPMAL